MPTVLPFHRAVLDDPAFTGAPFSVHTRWIETEFAGHLPPYAGDGDRRRRLTGIRLAASGSWWRSAASGWKSCCPPASGLALVALPPRTAPVAAGARRGRAGKRSGRGRGAGGAAAGGDGLVSPMQGTIVKIVAANGQHVAAGETVVVLEAMKMEQPLTAHKDGTVADLTVEVGQTVSAGQVICRLAD